MEDDELVEYIDLIVNIDELHNLKKESWNEVIRTIKARTGAINRQLSRVFGIDRVILEKGKVK